MILTLGNKKPGQTGSRRYIVYSEITASHAHTEKGRESIMQLQNTAATLHAPQVRLILESRKIQNPNLFFHPLSSLAIRSPLQDGTRLVSAGSRSPDSHRGCKPVTVVALLNDAGGANVEHVGGANSR
jgi:hypothetical protein